MNSIKIIKQNAKMWLGPKYSNKEYEIFKEGVEPFANRCIKEILEANNDEKKAPRTGFPKPTEKEKKEFEKMIKEIEKNKRHDEKLEGAEKLKREFFTLKGRSANWQKDIIEKANRVPQSFFNCHIHKRTKLTRFKSKKGNGQMCTKCNPKLIK